MSGEQEGEGAGDSVTEETIDCASSLIGGLVFIPGVLAALVAMAPVAEPRIVLGEPTGVEYGVASLPWSARGSPTSRVPVLSWGPWGDGAPREANSLPFCCVDNTSGLSLMLESLVSCGLPSSSFMYRGDDIAAVLPWAFRGGLLPTGAEVREVLGGSPTAGLCGRVLDLSLAWCRGGE